MNTNVFLIWAPECSLPLIVTAESEGQAATAFSIWVTANMPRWSVHPTKIEKVGEAWREEHPQVADAADRAKQVGFTPAILLFQDQVSGWSALGPDEPPRGTMAAIEPIVRSFGVMSIVDGVEQPNLLVFAHDIDGAMQLYLDHREATLGSEISQLYRTEEFSRWKLTGELTTLRQAMDMGTTGIAGRTADGAWSIYPPGHDRAGQ